MSRAVQGLDHRLATSGDVPILTRIMELAIGALQTPFLDEAQVAASREIMGLDTQLIEDRTYIVIEVEGSPVGCGGWSQRATLYGGDHSTALRKPALLDPEKDAARVRAMYTHPDHLRRGIGRHILALCEQAAAREGFRQAELMATLSGQPLYLSCGYRPIEHVIAEVGHVKVPLVRMGKPLDREHATPK